MLFVGDPLQLRAVDLDIFDSALFRPPFVPFVLTEVVRQDDGQFIDLLNRVRIGEETEDDLLTLQQHIAANNDVSLQDLGDAPLLVGRRNAMQRWNEHFMAQLGFGMCTPCPAPPCTALHPSALRTGHGQLLFLQAPWGHDDGPWPRLQRHIVRSPTPPGRVVPPKAQSEEKHQLGSTGGGGGGQPQSLPLPLPLYPPPPPKPQFLWKTSVLACARPALHRPALPCTPLHCALDMDSYCICRPPGIKFLTVIPPTRQEGGPCTVAPPCRGLQ